MNADDIERVRKIVDRGLLTQTSYKYNYRKEVCYE